MSANWCHYTLDLNGETTIRQQQQCAKIESIAKVTVWYTNNLKLAWSCANLYTRNKYGSQPTCLLKSKSQKPRSNLCWRCLKFYTLSETYTWTSSHLVDAVLLAISCNGIQCSADGLETVKDIFLIVNIIYSSLLLGGYHTNTSCKYTMASMINIEQILSIQEEKIALPENYN